MSNFKSEIGSLIRQARTEQGLTQKELGEKIGVGEPTVNKYESGKQNLTVETLKRVADALDMQIKITFHK
ncbi:helix-turn-helix domain-containing protein [Spirosoma sp. HMF3257]|uniref:XRE family transcriptional regulator n=1 Tax=Spirosoma telluris TaxID=2183553 RepID=A0A327NL11_9BACT|nr:helix-turn-helix domain-containing protein [Spirosoma telluris]RAI73248.1 XRE family transcriptional regulator [Spirosoma telluris]